MKYFFNKFITSAGFIFISHFAFSAEVAGPPFSVMDKNYVNVATLQVSPSLTDVSIGGERGLAHITATHSSSFGDVYSGGKWGPTDNYFGRVERKTLDQTSPSNWVWILQVSNGHETVDFREQANADGTFPALRDERYTLRFDSGLGFTMTKPDGTEIIYATTATTAHNTGFVSLSEIRQPNGAIIRITYRGTSHSQTISSVNINTGFQLKYLYEANTQGLLYDNPSITEPLVNTTDWHAQMPKYIVAINNAVEYCDPRHTNQGGTCNLNTLTRSWPKAEYTWPGGMPRAMVLYDTVFVVKDAAGRRTEYHHRPFETEMWKRTKTGWAYHPRIVAIKRAGDSEKTIHYDYKNHVETIDSQLWSARWMAQDAMLSKSMIGDSVWSYGCCNVNSTYNEISTGGGRPGSGVTSSITWKKPIKIHSGGYVYHARDGYKSGISAVVRFAGDGARTEYKYTRDNITKVIFNDITTQEAEYPASCHAGNRKICNQALWIKDGQGNRTDYTYDPAHGGILTETRPADPRGIRPQTRYGYTQHYAHTRNSSGVRIKNTEPIWLLTTTKACADSAYVGNTCTANDEVITTYEYNSDNLFLTGQTVKAGAVTRRSCFEYDDYGNQVSATEPNANLNSCN